LTADPLLSPIGNPTEIFTCEAAARMCLLIPLLTPRSAADD
jgi:hypothetical protein